MGRGIKLFRYFTWNNFFSSAKRLFDGWSLEVCVANPRVFFLFWNSGSLRLHKFFHSLLKCISEGKQKKERSGRLNRSSSLPPNKNSPWLLQNLEPFNLQWRQWMHLYFFYFPSGPLSFAYMQVPSSQERASKNFERTPLCLARFCPEANSRKALFPWPHDICI